MSSDIKNNPYVKEILIKYDVLKNALIEERKKHTSLEETSKILQRQANDKESSILEICKEKHELENVLALEKKRLEVKEQGGLFKSFFNKKDSLNIDKLNESQLKDEIIKLKQDKIDAEKSLSEALKKYEKSKEECKNLISTQTKEISSLETVNNDLKKLNYELNVKLQKERMRPEKLKMMKDRENFEEKIRKLREDKEDAIVNLTNTWGKLAKMTLEIDEFKEKINRQELDNKKLNLTLQHYKDMIMNINSKVHVFHGFIPGKFGNKEIDLTLGFGEEGKYTLKFTTDSKDFVVNILDVEFINKIEGGKVVIGYNIQNEKRKMNVLINELIIDQFIETYKDFYNNALKESNKLEL